MIAWLSGALLESDSDTLVLNAGGVGYEIAVTAGVQALLPAKRSPCMCIRWSVKTRTPCSDFAIARNAMSSVV